MPGMNCRNFEGALVEFARSGAQGMDPRAGLASHLEICDACRSALDAQVRLSAAARVLRAEAGRFEAPSSVERALLGALDSRRRSQRRRFVYGVMGGAIAAALAVMWWTTPRSVPNAVVAHMAPVAEVAAVVSPPPPPTGQIVRKRHRRASPPAVEPEQPFIAIPYTLPLEPYERAEIRRMDVPVAALIAAGFPTSMMDPGAHAQADVLVGQDGHARAIRLIAFSTSN